MQIHDLTLEVRDRDLNRLGQITADYLSAKVHPRWCGVGEWSLTLPGSHPMVEYLSAPGSGIILTGPTGDGFGTLLSGPTVTPTRTRNAQAPDGTLVFEGVTDEVVLQGTLAFPDPTIGDPAAQTTRENDTRSGSTEDLLRAFVAANIGAAAPASRRRGLRRFVTVPASLGRGAQQQRSPRFQNMLELLQEIVAYDPDLGFRVVQVDDVLEFQVTESRNLRRVVRFDIENGTLTSEQVQFSGPVVTDAIVAGGGEGVERMIVRRHDDDAAAAEALWGVPREVFIDQRQTEDVVELQQKGDEALLEGRGGAAVKLIPASDTMSPGVDWALGDVVSAVVGTEEAAARVTEIAYLIGADGVHVGAGLGDVSTFDPQDAQTSAVQSLDSRVAHLERVGGAKGGGAAPLPAPVKVYGAQANTITATDWGTAVPGTSIQFDAPAPIRVLVVAGAWVGNSGGITRAGVRASGATNVDPPAPGWGMVMMSVDQEGSEQRAISSVVDLAAGVTTFSIEAYRSGTDGRVNYPVVQVIPLAWIGQPGNVSNAIAWGDVQGKPTEFPPSAHSHTWAQVEGKPSTFTPAAHSHGWDSITGKPTAFPPTGHGHAWSELTGVPATFAPSTHSHSWDSITGKPSTFAPATHSHAWDSITSKPSTFPPSSHTHTVAQVEFTVAERDATSGQETYPTGVSIHQTTGEGWPSATATVVTFNHGPHRCAQMTFDKETPKVWERTATGPTTWTAWTDLYVPAATESVVGKSRMATDAETQAGTASSVSVTPKSLAALTASNARRGLAAIASQQEVLDGADTGKFVTPATLAGLTAQNARAGIVALATAAEVQAGTDTGKAVTAAGLATLTAQNTRRGLASLATAAEVQTGTDTGKIVTPAGLTAALDARAASNSERGLVFLASVAEGQAGTDTGKAVTPAVLKGTLDARSASNSIRGLVFLATAAEGQTGTDTGKAVTPAVLKATLDDRSASNSERGLVFLASAAEVQTGTDTGKAVTPAGLAARTAQNTRAGIAALATAAEVQAGTDTGKIVTPAGLATLTASNSRRGLAAIASQAEVDAGAEAGKFVSPLALKGSQGIVRGDDGRKYRMLGGVIRNTGAGFQWISDTGHAPMGFSGAPVTSADSVTIPYGFTASKVISLVATPDDGFATLGYSFGASVGLDEAVISAGIADGFHDYVRWDGSKWVSSTGFITSVTMNATSGLIQFMHADIGTEYQFGGAVTLRTAGANRMSQEGSSATQIAATVFPYNSATSLKAPTTDLRFWITRPGRRRVPMSELVQAGTNIWIQGLMEIA